MKKEGIKKNVNKFVRFVASFFRTHVGPIYAITYEQIQRHTKTVRRTSRKSHSLTYPLHIYSTQINIFIHINISTKIHVRNLITKSSTTYKPHSLSVHHSVSKHTHTHSHAHIHT